MQTENVAHPQPRTRPQTAPAKPSVAAAFAAADKGDWDRARAAARTGGALVEKLILWRFLVDAKTPPPFDLADRFLKENPDWPLRDTLFARAEAALPPNMASADVVAWYGGREPVSVGGLIRLGEAERATGRAKAGTAHIRKGWIRGEFSAGEEKDILARDGAALDAQTQKQRLDALLWRNSLTSARRQMLRVDAATRQLAEARFAVKKGWRSAAQRIAALPPKLAADPALTLERARALRRSNQKDNARALLRTMPTQEIAQTYPWNLWIELSAAARQALRDGKNAEAYRLVASPGFPPDDKAQNRVISGRGVEYADAQFLAGWIALRKLGQPQKALAHFRNLTREVSRPISAARGLYWQGRAYEALNDPAGAWGAYRLAADYPETFYGQLAIVRCSAAPKLALQETRAKLPPAKIFAGDEQVRAMRILAAYDQNAALRSFALHYQQLHPDAGHVKRLLALIDDRSRRPLSVRLAKRASYRGITFLRYAYPVISVPRYRGAEPAPETALVHALIRQETEFDEEAISPSGARGLMQVMSSGARQYARHVHLRYSRSRLTRDAAYNMQLGMAMVIDYLNKWDGSLILGAAAYNAGPTNARRWVNAFGDPRQPGVDPIDWIEQIPFGETRNYVQRVVENLQIYRSRLAGKPQPLKILSDIYGDKPPPPPLAYRPPPPVRAPQK